MPHSLLKTMVSRVMAGGLTLGLLAGCSASGRPEAASPTPKASSASPSATASASVSAPSPSVSSGVDACQLLDKATITALMGGTYTKFNQVEKVGLPGCEWSNDGSVLSVTSVPADQWAASMPSTVAMARIAAKGNQEVLDRLDRTDALFTGTMTADQACAAFSTMIQWQGLAADEWRIVNYAPDLDNPTLVVASGCRGQRYSTVQLAKPVVAKSEDQTKAMFDALDAADAAGRG